MSTISLPAELMELLKEQASFDYPAFLASLQEASPVSIRLNPHKGKMEPALAKVPWCDNGYYLERRPLFTSDPLLHCGAYYVQEASSMFLEQAVKTIREEQQQWLVLDLCAAPGGKASHLASLFYGRGFVVANDVIKSRSSVLSENITKWGLANTMVTNLDPSEVGQHTALFDLMLVDAPCSGEGMIRKEAAALENWSPDNVKLCSERQQRILADTWKVLKPGGYLIYSTCTFNRSENEYILEWMSSAFGAESVRINCNKNWGIQEKEENGMWSYRMFPHLVRGEGLFMALLRKPDAPFVSSFPKKSKAKPTNEKQFSEKINEWAKEPESIACTQFGEKGYVLPAEWSASIVPLAVMLKAKQVGIPVGERKGKDVNPLQGLACWEGFNSDALPKLDLNHEDACRFLRKEDLVLHGDHGLHCITFKNNPIGFAKLLGNRANNYYPKEWRILMDLKDASFFSILEL